MTVTIELKPETEKRIQERAKRRGKAIEAYLEDFIEENIVEESDKREKERPFHETATKEEWLVEFHRWLDSHKDKNYPSIPDEALRRENMYEDRF